MGKFYKRVGEYELEAQEIVKTRLYTLRSDDRDKSNLPDDWYWFENEDEARYFFQIPKDIWTKTRAMELARLELDDMVVLLNKVTPGYIPEAFIDREIATGLAKQKRKITPDEDV